MILVAGEALIDRIVPPDGQVVEAPGGAPFNTARTIARLGGRVAFLGCLSTDARGALLRQALDDDGVDLRWAVTTDAPTTLAIAHLDATGAATYRFELDGTAAPGLRPADVAAAFGAAPDAVHLGSLGLVAEPIGSALAEGLERLSRATVVMVDPNCRPAAIVDRDRYLQRLRAVISRADVVKVSGDDLAFMAPDVAPEAAARTFLAPGPRVVLLTDGARTIRVVAGGYAFDVPVPAVEVVDTVGAGDAFGGAFLAWLMESGGGRAGLAEPRVVGEAVELAIEIASLTCQRSGADPPRRAEVAWPAR